MKRCLFLLIVAAGATASADDADKVCARAVQLHQAGDIAGAIPQYESCLAAKPGLVELRSNYGAALVKSGRYQDAVGQYQKALAGDPGNPQLRYNLVLAYYKQGDILKAVEALQPLRAGAPQNMQVVLLLADCYLRLGEMKQVIDLLAPLEEGHREDPGFAYLFGTALIRNGETKRGAAVVDRILRDANSAEAHFLIAHAAFANQDFPGAVREFGKTVEMNSNLPSAWSFYGLSLLYTGDSKAAAEAFRKELAANPNDYEANVKLGAILSAAGQFSGALPFLTRAQLVRPDSAETRAELIPVYEHLGRAADAAREKAALARLGISAKPAASDTGLLAPGSEAPQFSLPALTGGSRITLPELLKTQPVVLVFGSYTCPQLRFGAPALNRLYEAYGARVRFVMVYVHEAHADDNWQSTVNQREGIDLSEAKTLAEKQQHAVTCSRKLNIGYPVAVDGMDRQIEQSYNAWPSAVYLVGQDGRIARASRLGERHFHPQEMAAAIERTLRKTESRRSR